MPEDLELPDDAPDRDRAKSLFAFLKEFSELRSRTVRTYDQYESVLFLSEIPREIGCDCAAWHRGRESELGEAWLEVHQPRLEAPPSPTEELAPWMVPGQVADSSREMPELLEEISVRVEDELGEDRFERRLIAENGRIRELWERYVEDDWWPWAEADRRNQDVQRVYTELFSIYQKQQRLGEQYEIVMGLGLLYWQPPSGLPVQRHLVTAKTALTFDAARGIMSVGPAGEGAKTEIEQDMLEPTDRPDPGELRALSDQIDEIADQIWEPTRMDTVLSGWVRSASPRGVYGETLAVPERIGSDPVVHLAPALILRKRTERSFLKAFEEIIRQLEEGQPVPKGVRRFVTIEGESRNGDRSEDETRGTERPNEIYFPLESNEAQRQIVERIAHNQGVLVQGPPGTGKSHTIVNLVCHLLATGQRVLVTSHTARALGVLQRYIRERASEISPLAVVLLGDDRESLQAMEDSVQGITSKQNHWDADASSRRIQDLERRLDEARRAEARVLERLRALREQETFQHPERFGGYKGTLKEIAARLREEKEWLSWFEDRPSEGCEPPLSNEQFASSLDLMRSEENRAWEATGFKSLTLDTLPAPERVEDLIASERQAQSEFDSVASAREHSGYSALARAEEGVRKRLIEELEELFQQIEQIERHLHEWTGRAVVEILGDHDRAWRELFEITQDHLTAIGDRGRWCDEQPISWLLERDHHEVRADAEAVLAHLEGGGGWGIGPFRAAPVKRGLYLRREVKIGGRPCDSPEAIRDLVSLLEVEERLRLLRDRWASTHAVTASGFSSQVRDFEDLCEPLEAALDLHGRVDRIRSIIQGVSGLAEPVWHQKESLQNLLEAARGVHFEIQLDLAKTGLEEALVDTSRQAGHPGIDPVAEELVRSLRDRSCEEYASAYASAEAHSRAEASNVERDKMLSTLSGDAPSLVEALRASVDDPCWDERSQQLGSAWNWGRASAWLEALLDPDAERQFRLQLDRERDSIRKRLEEIASEKAWLHCFDRMQEHERQHLEAWAQAVRRIGKGTGKYAPIHRRNAREHMNECRSAIPAWIMPLYRVAETIKPGTDLFDVVIVDEASQSGPEALLLTYLANKMIVVGDDKQISPTYAGIVHADVDQIRARHVHDLPHADSLGVHASFFDLARIRYQGRIRLREHFRCMPEIIQFSNKLCYASEPLIPLRQYGESRLSPVVSAVHVPDGYMAGSGANRSNLPEAESIVERISAMHEDAAYNGKTFGVISLLGSNQAKLIESQLLEKLGPEAMERRQLVCGDAYAFQGDERDVMFLSLVSAPTEGRRIGTLTQEADKRRFNVAASRARDQLLLFHSATLNDLSPLCLRYALLEYCLDPTVESAEVAGLAISDLRHLADTADRDRVRPPEPFDSWFEVDVLLRIAARGYRVIPQFEVARYRIDIVVEGMTRRIAVECDGDAWHGPEQYDADMARQRMLERCGWRFWRVRGSAFALDPDAAMEDLWETLEREGIYPDGSEPVAGSVPHLQPANKGSRIDEANGETGGIDEPESSRDYLPAESAAPLDVDEPGDENDDSEDEESLFDLGSEDSAPLGVDEDPAPTPTPAHSAAEVRGARGDSVDASRLRPYVAFEGRAGPDPRDATVGQVAEGLVRIVEVEGPVLAKRAYDIYLRGCGVQRMGKEIRKLMNRALQNAVREARVFSEDEDGRGGLLYTVLRMPGSPVVRVRERGARVFGEIPKSELVEIMTRVQNEAALPADSDVLYRSVLEVLDLTRLTEQVKARLQEVGESLR